MQGSDWDKQVRLRTFGWIEEVSGIYQDVLPRSVLQQGFILEDQRIPLVAPNGIFTPKRCDYPLSITTIMNGPYPDRFEDAHRLSYRYRGTDPEHRDNVGLRKALRDEIPLVYFFAVKRGHYQAIWPVYVTGDDPASLTFTVMADVAENVRATYASNHYIEDNPKTELRREYATATVQRRLHQTAFRERVLDAYKTHCAMCHLRHRDLLDAAHIIPDADPEGLPYVSNGLSLCKIHHAAFDRNILGVRPDYMIEVRQDILEEVDGPMLKYGLQALHGSSLFLPSRNRDRPANDALAQRYHAFTNASENQ